jgi:hypothetical protein
MAQRTVLVPAPIPVVQAALMKDMLARERSYLRIIVDFVQAYDTGVRSVWASTQRILQTHHNGFVGSMVSGFCLLLHSAYFSAFTVSSSFSIRFFLRSSFDAALSLFVIRGPRNVLIRFVSAMSRLMRREQT